MNRFAWPNVLRTASFRLAALYVGLFAASALLLGVAVYYETRAALEEQTTSRIEMETAFLAREYRTGGLDHLLTLVNMRGRGAGALDYLVENAAHAHLAGEIPTLAGRQPGWTATLLEEPDENDGRPEQNTVLMSDLGGGVLLGVGNDMGQIAAVEQAIITAFIGTVGLAALLGIGGGILLSRTFLARVDAIARTAEAIIAGDFARRVPLRGTDDDLDRLARTLNRMLDRIDLLMESLRQVGSDVAHDLRTPLSRLFQRLEGTRAHACSVAEYEEAVEGAIAEAQNLLETFSALLRIAQVEGALARAGFREVDLSAVVETVTDAYRPDAEQAGHRLTATVAAGITVRGDQQLLTQALANLLENALRHTPPGSAIHISLLAGARTGVRLMVEDTGHGVPADDLRRLTNRFFRTEQSRTAPGNGLGLSLVSAVAALHGATLSIANGQPGLRVSILLPAAASPATAHQPALHHAE